MRKKIYMVTEEHLRNLKDNKYIETTCEQIEKRLLGEVEKYNGPTTILPILQKAVEKENKRSRFGEEQVTCEFRDLNGIKLKYNARFVSVVLQSYPQNRHPEYQYEQQKEGISLADAFKDYDKKFKSAILLLDVGLEEIER